jgi:hypothetical protein
MPVISCNSYFFEVIDFDYLKLEPSDIGYEHVLVILDRYSRLFDIFATPTPTATHTAESLSTYFSYHDVVRVYLEPGDF